MGRTTPTMAFILSICIAAGCNSIIDAGEPTVVPPEDTDPPDDGQGGSGGVAAPICGDGKQQDGEQCDDGNDDPNDGCDACVRPCGTNPEVQDPDSGHCYRISDAEVASWEQANLNCEAWGGSLVSLESPDELTFVQNRVTLDSWTGARAAAPGEDMFAWPSGEAAIFDPEPEGDGDCIKLGGELLEFTRDDCEAALHFVCERGAASP